MGSRRLPGINQKGFTLIEVLFSLIITLLIVINSATLIRFVYQGQNVSTTDSKIHNSIKLLSQNIACGYDFQYGLELSFKNEKDEDITIALDNKKRLVMTPGHYIYCHDIDRVYFTLKHHLIYIELEANKKIYTFLIGSDYDEPEGDSVTSYSNYACYYYF